MKVRILNKSEFDVAVDTVGNNDPKDKVIIPAKVCVDTVIESKQRRALMQDKRIDVTFIKD